MEGSNVSLWMDPTNEDYAGRDVVMKGHTHSIVRYSGSTNRKLDKHVLRGARFFRKRPTKPKPYKYVGVVVSVSTIGTETKDGKEFTVFELVVKHEKSRKFRLKTDACALFGWAPLNSFNRTQGIICNVRI